MSRMSERKYTDEQIVKALECCSGIGDAKCVDCPYHDAERCAEASATDAIDLINRQKAEIAVLITAVDNSTKEFLKLHDEYQDQKKEIERLSHKCEDCAGCVQWNCDCSIIKTEAIKEFAERLHKGIDDFRDKREMVMLPYTESALLIVERKIDNLVAEMTEGK